MMQNVAKQPISLLILAGALLTFAPLFLKLGGVHLRFSFVFLFLAVCLIPIATGAIKFQRVYSFFLLYYLYVLVREVVTLNASAGLFIDLTSKALLFSVFFTTYAERMDSKIIIWMVFLILFFVVAFHIYSGHPSYYKLIGEAKPLFGLLPILFYHFRRGSFRIGLITSFAMLVLSGERKALLGCLLALSPPFLFRYLGRGGLRLIGGFALVGLATLLVYVLPSVLEFLKSAPTLESIPFSAVSDRERIWQLSLAYQALAENFIFGGGYNFTAELYAAEYGYSDQMTSLHSVPLVVLLDSGIMGLAFWGVFLWCYYKGLIKGDAARSSIFIYAVVLNCFMPVGFITELLLFLPLLFPRRTGGSG